MNQLFVERMVSMFLVPHGFHQGEGVALDHADLGWFSKFYCQYIDDAIPAPAIYPTVEPAGGIRLEWTFSPFELSITVDLKNKTGEWHVCEGLTGDTEESEEIDFADVGEWAWVNIKLNRLAKGEEL